MNAKILVVDDDPDLLDVVAYVLRRQQFAVVTAADGLQALDAFAREAPDLVILDVNMPGLDGFEVARRIRAVATTPIIMLTVRSEDADVVGALRLGADEYVTKPFSTSQLVARVQALLRRASGQLAPPAAGGTPAAALQLDLASHAARWRERTIPLAPEEYRLLDYLLQQGGGPVPTSQVVAALWGATGSEELLKVHLGRLREKLEADPSHPALLRLDERGLALAATAAPARPGG
ncbi:MAG TPA: response regulator transcription factor [Chloroflexota bacterium]|nr:response regulator transcription factor [Chloroflexota bacterium]